MRIIKKYKENIITTVVLLLLSGSALRMLVAPGFYEPHDLHHFADIYQMARALLSGQIPPRLGPDFSFGYGYPLFNFYYVLPFYIGAIIYFISGAVTTAYESVFILSILLSVFGMYLFLREFLSRWASIVGSILFLYTPYRAVQIYVRGAMGEALALSLMPFVFWGLFRLIKSPKKIRNIVMVSLIISLFILSHNYLWALTMPFVLLFILVVVDIKKIAIVIKSAFLAGLLALGISAYWWLPALIEQRLVSSTTPFPLIDHFPFIKQLILPYWGYGSSVWGPTDMMSFQIGLVNIGIIIASVLVLLSKKANIFKTSNNRIALWAVAGFSITFVMMNIRTYPLWKILPFHDFVQFPWRLLIFTTFFTAILSGYLVDHFKKIYSKLTGSLIIIACILLTYNYFKPSQIFYKTDEAYLTRFFASTTPYENNNNLPSQDYLNYSEDYLLLPNWVEERPKGMPASKIEIDHGSVENIKKLNLVNWKANINSPQNSKVTFNSYYFPGWYAKLDGKPVEISVGKPYGQIEINIIDEGEHRVEFYWKETPMRKIADGISVMSLLLGISLVIYGKKKSHVKK